VLVVDDRRLVFYLCVRPKSVFNGYVNERDVSSEQPRPVRSWKTLLK